MAFADTYVAVLGAAGISLAPSDLPDPNALQSGTDRLEEWLNGLEPDTRLAADEVTADFPVSAGLGDPEVNIAPELLPILAALDEAPVSLSATQLVAVCRDAFAQASADR